MLIAVVECEGSNQDDGEDVGDDGMVLQTIMITMMLVPGLLSQLTLLPVFGRGMMVMLLLPVRVRVRVRVLVAVAVVVVLVLVLVAMVAVAAVVMVVVVVVVAVVAEQQQIYSIHVIC